MERMIIAHNRVCREEGEKGIGGLDCDQVAAFHGFRHSTGRFSKIFFLPKPLFSRESPFLFCTNPPTFSCQPRRFKYCKAPPP